MKQHARLIKAFGHNEYGLVDFPQKISGTSVSRVKIRNDNGCSRCFPHGYETVNSHIVNRQRCWKRQRKTQWK
ncbi:phosphate ABC transporter substrate-binding protein [Massilia sp. CCM 8733]|uniref:Phosphate ABC transporter substrate-binding protein n=1 Tax=Massilia mucilaginosa TaxID=2609282 RepID=A0ABX0NXX3_9BURK|nr:phosphate ABC transporter substrate-binding protein [Massilia mucilaginosa]NHZ91750.1 phosphate ABC transporter substrate-binding protein [Massilia mucilaginosa]